MEPTTLAGVAPALRPVRVGTVTAAEVTVAIVTVNGVLLFFLFELLEINTRGEGRLVFNNKRQDSQVHFVWLIFEDNHV